jgi:chromosome segregation ATPase
MSDTTISGVSSNLDGDVSVSDLAEHVQSLTERIDDLERKVAEKDERIEKLEEQATIEWRGETKKAANLWVGPYPLGKAVERHGERLDDQDGRLGKIKRQRSKDGLSYQETRLVMKADVEIPGEVTTETRTIVRPQTRVPESSVVGTKSHPRG